MPGDGPKSYPCCLCKRRTIPSERVAIKAEHLKLLERRFCVSAQNGDFLCSKCRLKCYREENKLKYLECIAVYKTQDDYEPPIKKARSIQQSSSSPSSVTLDLPTTSKSHAYCFVCKRPGPKIIVVPPTPRFDVYLRKGIFVPAGVRCCPVHLDGEQFTDDALDETKPVSNEVNLNKTNIKLLLEHGRSFVIERTNYRLDFDHTHALTDEDYLTLTGISKTEFDILMTYVDCCNLRETTTRRVRTCVAILLIKLRCGLSNNLLATLFAMKKHQVRRALKSATKALKSRFVPEFLGFPHIEREEVIESHTRPLAKELFTRTMTENPAILVLDGTYIYVQKSGNFSFSRRSYSLHKHRPLVKLMLVVTTTGYIVSVLGPYLADSKNSDTNIRNHMIRSNAEQMKEWVREGDIFVVDRDFRYSGEILNDLGITMEMPTFLPKGATQLQTKDANCSRLVTKIRWVVESANSRLKTWRLLDKTLPNTHIPSIGDYAQIICALCNKFRSPLSSGTFEKDIEIAAKMKVLARSSNELQTLIIDQGLVRRSYKWTPLDASEACPLFPQLSEDEIRELTLGVYQVKLARSYTQEHCSHDGSYMTFL